MRRARLPLAVALCGALFYAVAQRSALGFPFYNEDFLYLDRARRAGFLDLWAPVDLAFQYWRPWSRELHFWTLQHAFGASAPAFHAVNLVLWLAVLACFAALAARVAGARAACLGAALLAALSAWSTPLAWASGAQELWMLLFALLTLLAMARERRGWAVAALAGALLSKETAIVLPAIAWLGEVTVGRRASGAALRRVMPLAGLTLAWALVHPLLGGRWFHPAAALEAGPRPALGTVLAGTVGTLFNLDGPAAPEPGWGAVAGRALAGAALLAALALLPLWKGAGLDDPPRAPRPSAARALTFGAGWTLLGWAPLLMPTLGWHPYYGLLGVLGAMLALGLAAARPAILGVALVAALATLQAGRAATPGLEMDSEAFRARAVVFHRAARSGLERLHPEFPRGSHLYFADIPDYVGFLASDARVARVWYADTTLRGGYVSQFRARAGADTAGGDYFFRFDPAGSWVEIRSGERPSAAALAANSRWESDHRDLALALGRGGGWGAAAGELERLFEMRPGSAEYAYNAAVCHEQAGQPAEAARWYRRAAALPGATPEMQSAARAHADPETSTEERNGKAAQVRRRGP